MAAASTVAPSAKSMERESFASRPALKSLCGSSREAPLKKLSLTWSLKAPAEQTLPPLVQTAVPHFQSSLSAGSASPIRVRRRPSSSPRQSSSPAICVSICSDAFTLPSVGCLQTAYVQFLHLEHGLHDAFEPRRVLVGEHLLEDKGYYLPR